MVEQDPTNGAGENRAKADDKLWFDAYAHRKYRRRDPFSFEFRQPFDPERNIRLVVVRRDESGAHVRAWVRFPKDEAFPDDDDASLRILFERGTVFDAPRP